MTQALIVQPSGTIDRLEEINLEALQQAVGGYVQALVLAPDVTAWINEEGKFADPVEYNVVGTRLVARSAHGLLPGDFIAGPMVLTGGTDDDGNTLPLSPEWQRTLLGIEA